MTTCAHCGGYELAARRKSGPALPRSTFGTPEDLIDRGTAALAKQTERLGEAIAKAVHGKTSGKAIRAAIIATGRRWNRERLADPLERELSHGAWLGALDADFEARTNRPVKIESFAALHAPLLLAPYDKSTDPAFATRPVGDARKQFERREAVTRDVYDRMTAAARRRATTVAGAATNEVVRTVQRELVQQVAKGAELRDFAKRVVPRLEAAGWTPQNASHVENVLRTNVSGAYNSGRARQMTQSTVLRFRPFWQIVTVNDGPPRQRPTHQAAHLVVLRADDPFWLTAYPPFGYQCFLPQTQMQGVILGASRAWYRGQAFELTTVKGRRLAVTADHPILTAQGFAPARSLRVGDNLVCYCGQAGVEHLTRRADHHEHDAPSSAEQVFHTLAHAGSSVCAGFSAEDFHGEAARFDGKIDVVGSYRELMLAHDAAGAQQLQQLTLEDPDLGLSGVTRACRCDPARKRFGHATASLPGAIELPFDEGAIGFDSGPLDPLRVGPAADLDALQPESTLQGAARDAATVGELFHRCPGSVEFDQIADIRELYWNGHVYDFEGGGGLVIAGGVFASNCRCRVRSLGRRQGEQLVVSGTSIHDLPDRGFTSGLSILDVPPPDMPPANDTMPPPANDT